MTYENNAAYSPAPFLTAFFNTHQPVSELGFDWVVNGISGLLRDFEHAVPADVRRYPTKIEPIQPGQSSGKQVRFSIEKLAAILASLTDGVYDMVDVEFSFGSLAIHVSSDESTFRLLLSSDVPMESLEALQEKIIDFVLGGVIQFSAHGGYITFDSDSDPYRRYIIPDASHDPNRSQRVFGYYWLSLLSPLQVKLLASAGRPIKNAPVYRIRELESGYVALQLSESIGNYSDAQLMDLREFLSPLLKPGKIMPGPRYGRVFETVDREPFPLVHPDLVPDDTSETFADKIQYEFDHATGMATITWPDGQTFVRPFGDNRPKLAGEARPS
jgi:hypothetical protein